ncbi:flagellar hook-length control protein FliK [Seohaeicola nanhaiensis]|uniref:Flagellar hook-length control protein FliK n=1 Tax=Seohaeicola nanhaiensis TaxID=1387282 RepID=A0ABV9KDL3_9RHOB
MQLLPIQTSHPERALPLGPSLRFDETSEAEARLIFHALYRNLQDMPGLPAAGADGAPEGRADADDVTDESGLNTGFGIAVVAPPRPEPSAAGDAGGSRSTGVADTANAIPVESSQTEGNILRRGSGERSASENLQAQVFATGSASGFAGRTDAGSDVAQGAAMAAAGAQGEGLAGQGQFKPDGRLTDYRSAGADGSPYPGARQVQMERTFLEEARLEDLPVGWESRAPEPLRSLWAGDPTVAVTGGPAWHKTLASAVEYSALRGAEGTIALAGPQMHGAANGLTGDDVEVTHLHVSDARRVWSRPEAAVRPGMPETAGEAGARMRVASRQVELPAWTPFLVPTMADHPDVGAQTLPSVAPLVLADGFRGAGGSVVRSAERPPPVRMIVADARIALAGNGDVDEQAREGGLLERAPTALSVPAHGDLAALHSGPVPQRTDLPRVLPQNLAESLIQQSGRHVEVTLNPEELGRVRMLLSSADGNISLIITGERQDTLDLLRRHIDALVQDFRKMGFENVGYEFRQFESGGRRDRPTAAPSRRSAVEVDLTESTTSRRHTAASGLDIRV